MPYLFIIGVLIRIFMHFYQDLISIFHDCFFLEFNAELVRGEDEPLYLPADSMYPHHRIIFAHGFYASALHEIAHWLIAGDQRRKLVDFGYWYEPDGRSSEQQKLFQQVEIKPQAIEWILSQACGFKFRVSIDNLNGSEADTLGFKQAVLNQVIHYCRNGLPQRTKKLQEALAQFYKTDQGLKAEDFSISVLD